MLIDEQFDADDVLRDMDERFAEAEDDLVLDDDMRELDFGNMDVENANFRELASDIDNAEDLWE
ncbi:MAG: hypothetical protein GF401_06300 [Chitinivibrionales bacterium]|nr:hypothetical protein [Chitinivibrionales bacterium]